MQDGTYSVELKDLYDEFTAAILVGAVTGDAGKAAIAGGTQFIKSEVIESFAMKAGATASEAILKAGGTEIAAKAASELGIKIYTIGIGGTEPVEVEFETPAEVVAAALDKSDSKALQTLNMFCEGMGSAAGNLALTFGAKGGIYIAGGVIPRFQEFFINSGFRSKFEDKGRFVSYLQPIPVFIVVRSNLGLLGAAKKLQQI